MADQTFSMIGPDGSHADVPADSVSVALKQGAQHAMQMKGPDGTLAYVPFSSVGHAFKAGAVPVDLSGPSKPNVPQEIPRGAPERFAAGVAQGLPHVLSDAERAGATPAIGVSPAGKYTINPQAPALNPFPDPSAIPNQVGELYQRAKGGDVAGTVGQAVGTAGTAYALHRASQALAGPPQNPLPSLDRARATYESLTPIGEQATFDLTQTQTAAQKALDFAKRGGQRPKVATDFIRRVAQGTPLTYEELQDFASNASGKLATDIRGNPLRGKARAKMADFASSLRSDISSGLEQASPGAADQYAAANRDYGGALGMRKTITNAAKVAIPATGVGLLDYYIRKAIEKR